MGTRLGLLSVSAGDLYLTFPDEVDAECTAITCSLVGAPGASSPRVTPRDFLRSVQNLIDQLGLAREEVVLISNENGATATVNGWWQAAALGIRLADIPCNGRAHPLGIMGAMGLEHQSDYRSHQAAVGGDPQAERYCEVYVQGDLPAASGVIRSTSETAGGLVAVARNPVSADYALEHGAPGGVAQALRLGEAWLAAETAQKRMKAVQQITAGEVVATGRLQDVRIVTRAGFSVGTVCIGGDGGEMQIEVVNEFMTLQGPGGMNARFPDLICLFDDQGSPLDATQLAGRTGDAVHIMVVCRDELILGAGAKNPDHWAECRRLLDEDPLS